MTIYTIVDDNYTIVDVNMWDGILEFWNGIMRDHSSQKIVEGFGEIIKIIV